MRTSIIAALYLTAVAIQCAIASEVCLLKTTDSLVVEARNHILGKLGMSEEPENPSNRSDVPEQLVDDLSAADLIQHLKPPRSPCALTDFLDKDVAKFPLSQSSKMVHTGEKIAPGAVCSFDTSVDFVGSYKLKFNPVLKPDDEIVSAELSLRKSHLYLSNYSRPRSQTDRVDVSLIIPPNERQRYGSVEYITTEFLHTSSISGLAVFNVTNALRRWRETLWNSTAYTGEIELEVAFRCPQYSQLFVPNFQFQDEKSILSVTTMTGKQKGLAHRERRQSDEDAELPFCDVKKDGCCLKKFTVNFERDLNMTWVLYPKEISFNYCSGLCPLSGVESTQHSEFLDRLRKVTRNPTAAGSPCCVPNSYRSKTIGVTVRGILSKLELPDIEATSCACR